MSDLIPSPMPATAAGSLREVLEAYNDGVQIVSVAVSLDGSTVEVTVLPDPGPGVCPRVDRFNLKRISGFAPVWSSK